MLVRLCPDHVEVERWQQAVTDSNAFLAAWSEQASVLGWSAADLLGLDTPLDRPHPSYRRLSRYDATGLIWLLQGREVVARPRFAIRPATSPLIVASTTHSVVRADGRGECIYGLVPQESVPR